MAQVENWGVDRDPKNRPGVPMEWEPHPVEGAHWTEPARQSADVLILKDPLRRELTPVFGTGEPPRGLSGLVRRWAYAFPDHKTKHWLLLLLADRINVLERLLMRAPVLVPMTITGGLLVRRLLRTR